MTGRAALRLALVAALLSCACIGSFDQSARMMAKAAQASAEEAGLKRRRTYHDKAAGQLWVEWQELVEPGAEPILHGLRMEYARDGTLLSERRYNRGEPTGLWRAWHPDGAPRMEADLGAPQAQMRWWHKNGTLASQGPLKKGVREGEWETYRDDGTLSARGTYSNGVRDGNWVFFDAQGAWSERGRYVNGVRFGDWERANDVNAP